MFPVTKIPFVDALCTVARVAAPITVKAVAASLGESSVVSRVHDVVDRWDKERTDKKEREAADEKIAALRKMFRLSN